MADIIDFRAKSKPYHKQFKNTDLQTKMGQIILFSGVRFERDETENIDSKVEKTTEFLTSKSN